MTFASDMFGDDGRAAALLDAQGKALGLFDEIERNLIRPGVSERALSYEIHDLAARMFGVSTHWHGLVIRTGANTQRVDERSHDGARSREGVAAAS